MWQYGSVKKNCQPSTFVETRRPSGDARSDAPCTGRSQRLRYRFEDRQLRGRGKPASCARSLTSRRESGLTLIMRLRSNFASLQV